MTYLLDTNVLSNSFDRRPNQGVIEWMRALREPQTFTSAVCIGELFRGLVRFPEGERRRRLGAWLRRVADGDDVLVVLPVTVEVAERWGLLVGSLEASGLTPPGSDSLIAATALAHNLTVVTRNSRDFERCGVSVLNPWT